MRPGEKPAVDYDVCDKTLRIYSGDFIGAMGSTTHFYPKRLRRREAASAGPMTWKVLDPDLTVEHVEHARAHTELFRRNGILRNPSVLRRSDRRQQKLFEQEYDKVNPAIF